MAANLLNRARMSTATTGTGTITLGSAVTKYLSFSEAGAVNGSVYAYCIEDGNDFEFGIGTYTSSGTTFSRDTVTASKISGTAGTTKLTLTGSAQIFISPRTDDLLSFSASQSFTSTEKKQAQSNLGLRQVATANTTWYVSKTGNDSNTGLPTGVTANVTFTNGSSNIGWTSHGRSVGDNIFITTTGGLPTNFTAGMLYYVKTVVDANTITVAATSGGTAISAGSAGTGTHTVNVLSPVLTVQKALDLVCAMDMSIYSATVHVAGGQYDQALAVKPTVGGSSFLLKGDVNTPGNVILTNNSGGWGVFYLNGPYNWSVNGFRLSGSGSNSGGIFGFNNAIITLSNIEWGACGNYHIWLNNGAYCNWGSGTMAVVASGTNIWLLCQQGGRCDFRGMTLSFSTNPTAYGTAFVQMNDVSDALLSSMTFTNKAYVTGKSHDLQVLSGINSAGATETGGSRYLPGNSDGTKSGNSVWT